MKKFVVSFFSALLLALSFISVIPAFAFSNSDLPTGSYNPDSDSEYLSLISSLIDKYPSYFENYIFMVPQTDSSFPQYGFYWFNCSSDNAFDLIYKSGQYYLKNNSFHSFNSYRCFYNYRNREFSKVYLNGSSSADYDYSCSWQIYTYSGNCTVKIGDSFVTQAPASFKSPVNAQFDFKSDLEFFCCLNDNASVLPVDSRVWIEVYDTLVAVDTLVYKPHKYFYTKTITSSSGVPNKYEHVIGDYLIANSVGPHYNISVDTLLHAGCKTDYFYTARAFVYNGSKPYEVANFTFKISSEGISTVDPSLTDPDNPDDPIMKTWNNDNRTYNYYNVNTGAEVDKDKLVYKFDSSVDASVNGSGQDISDFDFNSDFSTDLTQGAGLVRTLFDKIIQSAGLSGFMITVLSVAVVGWFIFGSRR